jgi:hypothetical protein
MTKIDTIQGVVAPPGLLDLLPTCLISPRC